MSPGADQDLLRRIAEATQALGAGLRIPFGDWWISAAAFGSDSKTIPLPDIRAFRVVEGVAFIEAGADIRVHKSVNVIPDFLVFQHLLGQLRPELPEHASKTFRRRLLVRNLNKAFAVAAVVSFVIACMVGWPVHKTELCEKLSTLQQADEITEPLKRLRIAAGDYRGDEQEGVRADASELEKWKFGFHLLKPSDLDAATVSIRHVCQAPTFTF